MGNKKGLNTKVITVLNPDSDDELELFVTYEIVDSENSDDDENFLNSNYDIDIKSFEPNNDEEELPEWITEDFVYDSLYEELEIDMTEDEFTEEEDENGYNENYFDEYVDDEDY